LLGLNTDKLEVLQLQDNKLSESDLSPFSRFINLKELLIHSSYSRQEMYDGFANHFSGSLEPLKDLTKLEKLDIRNTNIDSGWKYLPNSLKYFSCHASKYSSHKVKEICKLFANDQDIVEEDEYGYIKDFPQKLQDYKQKVQLQAQIEQSTKI
jgi:Leucine-rich repeat (LRR) protein